MYSNHVFFRVFLYYGNIKHTIFDIIRSYWSVCLLMLTVFDSRQSFFLERKKKPSAMSIRKAKNQNNQIYTAMYGIEWRECKTHYITLFSHSLPLYRAVAPTHSFSIIHSVCALSSYLPKPIIHTWKRIIIHKLRLFIICIIISSNFVLRRPRYCCAWRCRARCRCSCRSDMRAHDYHLLWWCCVQTQFFFLGVSLTTSPIPIHFDCFVLSCRPCNGTMRAQPKPNRNRQRTKAKPSSPRTAHNVQFDFYLFLSFFPLACSPLGCGHSMLWTILFITR